MPTSRPTWVEIDLEALRHNLSLLRKQARGAAVVGVVKADGYGHGATIVAQALVESGVERLAVATVDEGLTLREAGIDNPIMVFSGVFRAHVESVWTARLEPVVFSHEVLSIIEEHRPPEAAPLPVHLQLDSGMGRLGCLEAEFPSLLERLRRSDGLELISVMTHLARADEPDLKPTMEQLRRFDFACGETGDLPRHAANSGALVQVPEAIYDWVRPGLALYGVEPVADRHLGVRPVMRWRSRIAHVRELPAGSPLGYGGRFVTQRTTRVAVLPVGYADGYPWSAEGEAEVIIEGCRVPLLGAVSMDMVIADVTDHPQLRRGALVTLLGADGSCAITASDLARWGGRHVYEVLTGVGPRVPRRVVLGELS